MTEIFEEDAPFAAPPAEEAFIVDVDGYEGPLDLLLAMARTQKVDLARISIVALADQYLAFVETARRVRLELAADYLVMAAWLAYLKSRLLLPSPGRPDEPSGVELAEALAVRLRRLAVLRDAATALMRRDRLGRDVFARGAPEGVVPAGASRYSASLYDLLAAYGRQRQVAALSHVRFEARVVLSLAEAREILDRLVGETAEWAPLEVLLAAYLDAPDQRASVVASSFASALELVREGRLDVHQEQPMGALYLRRRAATGSPP